MAEKKFIDLRLANIKHENFTWGRGWAAQGFRAELIEPQFASLNGYPLPWSPPTKGIVTGTPVFAPYPDYVTWSDSTFDAYFSKYKGQLRNRIVLFEKPRAAALKPGDPGKVYTEKELEGLVAPWLEQPASSSPAKKQINKPFGYYADRLMKFYTSEGVALLLIEDGGNGGGVMALSHTLGSNWLHFQNYGIAPPMAGLSFEHYNRIARLVIRNIPVKVSFEVKAAITENADTYSLVAEIKGSDKADEVVMIGAHLDSWTPGTGATDNAAGSAVMMEVMRILKTLDLKPRRSIRIALWGGHEGEGTGATTYVSDHFGSTASPKPEHAKISAYYNLDNGSGRIRGIYVNRNEKLVPIFKDWFSPFNKLGASAVSINVMTGTDHVPFERAGIPGFQFIQDPLDYPMTHHTNMDVYDYLKEDDLKQASAIIASFAYFTAMRDDLLPRK